MQEIELMLTCRASLLVTMCVAFMAVMLGSSAHATSADPSLAPIEPCPDKPNCVSSRGPAGPRHMEPIPFHGSVDDARDKLVSVIRSFPRTKIVLQEKDYVKAEFRSAVFAFVDDVAFEFDEKSKVIHFRSASRVGYYDFGANRKRMEEVIARFSSREGAGK